MNTYTEHLCPVVEHPELEHLDETGIRMWADAHRLVLHRDWRGLLCTSLEDAYKLRRILDEDAIRQAQSDEERRQRLEDESAATFAHLKRRLEAQDRKTRALAAIEADTVPFQDERIRDWEQRMDEMAAAMFVPPAPPPDTRTSLERLKDKAGSR